MKKSKKRIIKYSILAVLAIAVIALVPGIVKKASYFKEHQQKTLDTIQKLDDNIFLIDYKNDYCLDELLEEGVSSTLDLVDFATKKITFGAPVLSLGELDGGCSTFEARTPDGDHTLARNFDFKNAPCFVLWTHPENAYASIAVVDCNFMLYGTYVNKKNKLNSYQALLAPYCCVDGINEKGLSIAVLQIRAEATEQDDDGKKDITTTAMIRAVLDKCATVDEAVEFLKTVNMHDSLFTRYHYQIIDKEKSVVVEYVGDELNVIDNTGEIYADDGIDEQYVTNYYVTIDNKDDEAENHGQDRAAHIVKNLKEKGGVMTELESMDLLSQVKLCYDHPKYPWRIVALWSSVYNSEKCTLKIAANTDYKNIYTFSVNEPLKVQARDALENTYDIEWDYL